MRKGLSPSYRRLLLPIIKAAIQSQIVMAHKEGKVIAAVIHTEATGEEVPMTAEQSTWLGGGIATATVLPIHKLQPKGARSRIVLTDQESAELVADVLLEMPEFADFPVSRDNIAEIVAAEAIVQRQAAQMHAKGQLYAGT